MFCFKVILEWFNPHKEISYILPTEEQYASYIIPTHETGQLLSFWI